jgi:tripartite ATP-independent transporter DctM subunit
MGPWLLLTVMFGTLGVFIAAGVPIAVAFGITNALMLFFFVGGVAALKALALSSYSSVATFDFTALPMFLLMGSVVLHAGLARRAVVAIGKWLGRMPGRLAVLSVVAGTVLGGASGSSMADTATLGMILVPEMRGRGYDKHLVSGCLATCGALAVLIPPSGLMVIMGGIGRLPVGNLLIGGLVPGLLLSGTMLIYIMILATVRPHLAPAYDVESVSWWQRIVSLRDVAPLIALMLVVLGSMFAGIATPTEAAAAGAFGGFCLAAAYARLTRAVIWQSLLTTVEVSGLAMLIITSSTAFSQVLAHTGAAAALASFATGLPVSPWLIIVGMQFVMLVMGCFMDGVSIMLITAPLFFPVVKMLGFDPIWFAILTVVNIEVGLITPPFGLNLFVLKGVSPPDTTLWDIYKGVTPFIVLNLMVLAVVTTLPKLATWLPGLLHR